MTLDRGLRAVNMGLIVSLFAFQMFTAYTGNLLPTVQRSIHVGFVLTLAFLALAIEEKRTLGAKIFFILLAAASVVTCLYVIYVTPQILFQPGLAEGWDLVFGTAAVLLMIEATRRSVGVPLVVMFVIVAGYALLGPYLPGQWAATGLTWDDMIARLYMTDIGLWGFITGVSASELSAIILFAGFLMALGGVDFLRDAAIVIAGRTIGGAAKVANICSALFGMISGSSPANAAIVGNFTIPLMKRAGYPAPFAAAVEAAASTFGQLMPPVMGAAAFVLAEIIGKPYAHVMLAASIPAVTIYIAIYAALHFYSASRGMRGMDLQEVGQARDSLTWRKSFTVVLPVALLIWLIASGRTVSLAAFWALVLNALLYLIFQPHGWDGWSALGKRYLDGIVQGVQALVGVATLLVTAQAVVTLINTTGLAVVISQGIVTLAQTPLAVALIVASVTLVMGMGLPTTPAYIITAAIAGPAMLSHGFAELNAHMFIFYFALLSSITPPVCIAVFITAGLAGANWLRTAWDTLLISFFKYVLPFLFLFNSALLFQGSAWDIALVFVVAVFAGVLLEAVVFRFFFSRLNVPELVWCILAIYILIHGTIANSTPLMLTGVVVGIAFIITKRWLAERKVSSARTEPQKL